MNRRSVLGAIGIAPFAGKTIAGTAIGGQLGVKSASLAGSFGEMPAQDSPKAPLIDRTQAMRMVLADKEAIAEIRNELFEEHRIVHAIDPDIAIMKSWSDMAKITFQRQRNVERAMAELQEQRLDRPQQYIHTLTKQLNKLMWGIS